MKNSSNKKEDKKVQKIMGIPVYSFYNEIHKSEEEQWKEIQINLAELKTPNKKLAFLHKRLAEYYQNLPEPTLYASGQNLNQFPYLGKQFLDRKIQAEIDFIKSEQLRRRENMIFKKSLKSFSKELVDENLMSEKVLEHRTKILLLDKLGVIKLLQNFEHLKSADHLAQFCAELFASKQEEKKSIADSIVKNIRYISSKNSKYYPKTAKAIRKRDSILSRFGFTVETEI